MYIWMGAASLYIHIYVYMDGCSFIKPGLHTARLEELQRLGGELCEREASLGNMGEIWGPSWNPLNITSLYRIEGFRRGPEIGPIMPRDGSLSGGRFIFLPCCCWLLRILFFFSYLLLYIFFFHTFFSYILFIYFFFLYFFVYLFLYIFFYFIFLISFIYIFFYIIFSYLFFYIIFL